MEYNFDPIDVTVIRSPERVLRKFKTPARIPTIIAKGIPTVKKCVKRWENERFGRWGWASGGADAMGASLFKCDKIFETVIVSFSTNNDRAAIFNAGRTKENKANLTLDKWSSAVTKGSWQ